MRKNAPLMLIFMVVFIDLLGFGILIPLLPTFAHKVLNLPEIYIGISLAVYSLVQFVFNPILGGLSDKVGRKKIILFTLFLNAVGYIIFAYTDSLFLLILSRVVAGIGGSSIGVAQAYIADVTAPVDRAKSMGLIGVAFGLGFIFGPVIGGLLSHYGYQVTGFASAGFSVLALVLSAFFLPESINFSTDPDIKHAMKKRKILDIKAFKTILGSKDKAFIIVLFFILTFSVANIHGTFSLLGVNHYGLSDMQNGMMFGIIGIVSVIVQGGLIGRMSKKYSDKQLIVFGSICMMIGLAFIPYAYNIYGLALVCIILSVGTGSLQPILLSLISRVGLSSEQGLLLSVNQSSSAFARMLGPLWGGFAFQMIGYPFPFITGAFCALAMLIFTFLYFEKVVVLKQSLKRDFIV